jgi:hypothetical protein
MKRINIMAVLTLALAASSFLAKMKYGFHDGS